MNVFTDIETIPGQHPSIRAAIAADIEALKADVSAPGNYKDTAKIAEYIATRRAELDAQAEEMWCKTSFDGTRGEIICISWAVDEAPVQNVFRQPGDSEADMLRQFFDKVHGAIADSHGRRPCFVGHNVKDFDLRFIYQRSVILKVRPPFPLPHDARGNNEMMFDTMLAWAGWGNRISLDSLCTALSVGGKTDGVTGKDVWPMVQAGRIREVADYCNQDVECVRNVYRRLTFSEAA